MGGHERWPGQRKKQSLILDKDRLTGCCLVIRDHNTIDFDCLLCILTNEHVMNLPSYNATVASILPQLSILFKKIVIVSNITVAVTEK